MCTWCNQHGDRGQKWYETFDNYLFKKVFPDEAAQQNAKQKIAGTFASTEWRYSDPEFIRNQQFLQERASSGFGSQIV